MLNLLIDYAKTHGLTIEPGFKPKTVRWAIVCDESGQFLNVQELVNTAQKKNRGKTFNVCPDLSLPEMKAGGSGCRHFLVDNLEVVTLMGKNGDVRTDVTISDKERDKVLAKHAFFVSLLKQGASAFKVLNTVATMLESDETLRIIQRAFSEQQFRPTDNVTFAIPDRSPPFLVDDIGWHNWWRNFRQSLKDIKISNEIKTSKNQSKILNVRQTMRCLVSGDLIVPALTQPKIEGLSDVGGLSMGDSFMSFKQESFRSYFLVQSENSAVSENIASAYRAGLNSLIVHHSQRLTNVKVIYWYAGKEEVPDEFDPLHWLVEVEDTDVDERDAQNRARSLLDSIRIGKRSELLDYRFYTMVLSGASGRVMVRDWIEGQFCELVSSIDAWFADLSIEHRDGGRLSTRPKFLAVIGGLVRELNDISPPGESKMWHVAMRNEPIPEFAMVKALARVKIDIIQDVPMNHARMGLLKAYHIRKGDKDMKPYLNEEHPSPAYHCGRIMAILAEIQRYYAAASVTPALVLGRLVKTSNYHFDKINFNKKREGLRDIFTGVWCRLEDSVPKVLNLEDQSLFALGFYQQTAKIVSVDWKKYENQFTNTIEGDK